MKFIFLLADFVSDIDNDKINELCVFSFKLGWD